MYKAELNESNEIVLNKVEGEKVSLEMLELRMTNLLSIRERAMAPYDKQIEDCQAQIDAVTPVAVAQASVLASVEATPLVP